MNAPTTLTPAFPLSAEINALTRQHERFLASIEDFEAKFNAWSARLDENDRQTVEVR